MRRTSLTRSSYLKRKTRIRPRNARQIKRLRAKQFGPQAALCRTLPCCCCKAPPPSDPHHLKSRGAGGDDSWCIPVCRRCHDNIHRLGAQWFYLRHVNPDDVLQRMRMLTRDAEQTDGLAVHPMLAWLE